MVECNICGWQGDKFASTAWHLFSDCPGCRSGIRHRLLFAALSLLPGVGLSRIVVNKKVLHFAPDRYLSVLIKAKASVYKTADFSDAPGIDYNIDISHMKEVAGSSFDCVIACDVLEHVPDDAGAMDEIYRVLSPGGFCILTVPQKDGLKVTYENKAIDTPEGREAEFGQADHLRIYGSDFTGKLEGCGFLTAAIDETFFDAEIVEKHVLFPPVLSARPLATNYRKVFFGLKPINI